MKCEVMLAPLLTFLVVDLAWASPPAVTIATSPASPPPGCFPSSSGGESLLSRRYRACTESAELRATGGNPESLYRSSSGRGQGDSSALCGLLDSIVDECTPIMRPCHVSEQEFRSFRDSQVDVFVQVMSQLYQLGPQVSRCRAAQEGSGVTRNAATSLCNAHAMSLHMARYMDCTRDVNREIEAAIARNVANGTLVTRIFCNGIFKTVYGCSQYLRPCHSQAEMRTSIENQKELIRRVMSYRESHSKGRTSSAGQPDANLTDCSTFGGPVGPPPGNQEAILRARDLVVTDDANSASWPGAPPAATVGLLAAMSAAASLWFRVPDG